MRVLVKATSRPVYPLGRILGTHYAQDWVGPKAGQDGRGRDRVSWNRRVWTPDRPARCESLCCISNGSQSVLRLSQWISCHFPGDTWILFCNGCFEVYFFPSLKEMIFIKNNRETYLIDHMVFRMTVRISN